jgi:hypothetical protein
MKQTNIDMYVKANLQESSLIGFYGTINKDVCCKERYILSH